MGAELWTAIAVLEYQNEKLQELLMLLENLPETSKAQVLKRLEPRVGRTRNVSTEGLPVQFERNRAVSPLSFQGARMDRDSMAKVLQMMAEAMGGIPN
jgi:hypothetical protein